MTGMYAPARCEDASSAWVEAPTTVSGRRCCPAPAVCCSAHLPQRRRQSGSRTPGVQPTLSARVQGCARCGWACRASAAWRWRCRRSQRSTSTGLASCAASSFAAQPCSWRLSRAAGG
jgi:hypothetical protein